MPFRRQHEEFAAKALQNAIDARKPIAAIVHSDRGSQFRSTKYVHVLKRAGLQGSMGRVGACGDNAAMESFNALLQVNVLDRHRWKTRAELSQAITTWIETKYHRKRRQRRLGRQTPINFEKINTPTALSTDPKQTYEHGPFSSGPFVSHNVAEQNSFGCAVASTCDGTLSHSFLNR
jgi:transposase InsO family protein